MKGRVKTFNKQKGYGFIRCELEEDIFFLKIEPRTKDGKDFYIARYFTVENLEDIIDKLGFKNEVKIF